jgi:hypothetical protein
MERVIPIEPGAGMALPALGEALAEAKACRFGAVRAPGLFRAHRCGGLAGSVQAKARS